MVQTVASNKTLSFKVRSFQIRGEDYMVNAVLEML